MVKHFEPLRYGNNYEETPEYKEMRFYLKHLASLEELQEIFDQLPGTEMAWGGKNKGKETIQEHFWLWRKGTARERIELFFANQMEARNTYLWQIRREEIRRTEGI